MAYIRKKSDIKKYRRKFRKLIADRPRRPLIKNKTVNIEVYDTNNQIQILPIPIIEVTDRETSNLSKKNKKKLEKRQTAINQRSHASHISPQNRRPGGGTGGGGTNGSIPPRSKK